MKRKSSLPIDVIEHDGFHYATLDFVDASSEVPIAMSQLQVGFTQRAYLKVPEEWEIAPEDAGVVDVLTRYAWGGANCIIFANGEAFHTGLRGGLRGTRKGSGMLASACPASGKEHKPTKAAGDARIMIRTRAVRIIDAAEAHSEAIVGNLWKKRRFTDFTIVCQGQEVPCHRAVLAAGSPVFEAALTGSMREASEGRLEIKGAEPGVAEGMLSFLYTGRLQEGGREPAHLASLLELGDRYDVRSLVLACAEPLLDGITPGTVVAVTRALRRIKENPEAEKMWAELQKRLREDEALLATISEAV